MATVNLPEGMSPQAIIAALTYLAQQAEAAAYVRPSGVLPQSMMRGVNKNYTYEFRPYPKALTPPDVIVSDAKQEQALRIKWRTPLPWAVNDPEQRGFIAEYYTSREYPQRMTPPQIVVQDEPQEAAVMAAWRAEYGEDAVRLYPAWFFHATQAPVLVANPRELEKLGQGWFPTPAQAIDAAKGNKPAVPASEELERGRLMKLAGDLDIKVDDRMKTPKIRQLVETAQGKIAEQVI
jgi:hypothetical protein